MTMTKKFALLALAACLPGCAATNNVRTTEELAAHHDWFVNDVMDRRVELSRNMVERVVREQDQAAASRTSEPIFDILIISGGGERGAFGAGVIKGWGNVADPQLRRPEFDVVTGVSTGALIAPFAFVGTDEACDLAFDIYREPKPDWFRIRNLLSILLVRESFADNAGLRKEIETCVNQDMLSAIADGRNHSRLLLIGTTNLDLGMLTMWDSTRLADEVVRGGKHRSIFDDVILASTAIPGVFAPVKIDGDLYVDGGVTRNIAYTTDYDFEYSVVNVWKREHADRKFPKTRVWVIFNNQLGGPPVQLNSSWPEVAKRSLDVSVRSSTLSNLKALATSLELFRIAEGAEVEFRLMAIPDDWRPPVKGAFKKENMNELAEMGVKMGADPASWRKTVPNPESPGN